MQIGEISLDKRVNTRPCWKTSKPEKFQNYKSERRNSLTNAKETLQPSDSWKNLPFYPPVRRTSELSRITSNHLESPQQLESLMNFERFTRVINRRRRKKNFTLETLPGLEIQEDEDHLESLVSQATLSGWWWGQRVTHASITRLPSRRTERDQVGLRHLRLL